MLPRIEQIDFGSYELFQRVAEKNANPILTVICLTYKHDQFILQALDGFFIQVTDFDFQVMIFDDCSPDQTKQLVIEQIANHPRGHLIKYFRHKHNLGPNKNGLFALQQVNTKYVALCEGDDYWTSEEKLAIQAQFLEKNSNFSLCFHNTHDLVNGQFDIKYKDLKKDNFEIGDFVKFFYSRTSSIMFRWPDGGFPTKYADVKIGDWGLAIFVLQFGKAKYFQECMSVYRIHQLGIWGGSSANNNTIAVFESFRTLKAIVNKASLSLIQGKLHDMSISYLKASLSAGKTRKSFIGLHYFFTAPVTVQKKIIMRLFTK
jgi:glycosyltransferase involved in cell wall biosynthesis